MNDDTSRGDEIIDHRTAIQNLFLPMAELIRIRITVHVQSDYDFAETGAFRKGTSEKCIRIDPSLDFNVHSGERDPQFSGSLVTDGHNASGDGSQQIGDRTGGFVLAPKTLQFIDDELDSPALTVVSVVPWDVPTTVITAPLLRLLSILFIHPPKPADP